jgi:hypothetical protein
MPTAGAAVVRGCWPLSRNGCCVSRRPGVRRRERGEHEGERDEDCKDRQGPRRTYVAPRNIPARALQLRAKRTVPHSNPHSEEILAHRAECDPMLPKNTGTGANSSEYGASEQPASRRLPRRAAGPLATRRSRPSYRGRPRCEPVRHSSACRAGSSRRGAQRKHPHLAGHSRW